MIKTKFTLERSIIGCLISFFVASIIFTGCGKDYDLDIDRLTKKTNSHDTVLNTLQTQITAIQNNIANARWITSVEATSTGYVIHFNAGTPNPITISHGLPGTAAVIWQIGSGVTTGTYTDSVWHRIEGGQVIVTDSRAIPANGRDGVDGAPGTPIPVKAPNIVNGYWVTYEWDPLINDFKPTTHMNYPLAGGLIAYVVDNPDNPNQWILRVKKNADGDEYESIILPKNAAGFPDGMKGNVTLLGHVASPPGATLSLGTLSASPTLEVKYWYLDSIYNVDQSAKLEIWQGQKTIRPKQLLTTSPKETSLVLTSDITLSGACKLKNSKGEALPLVISAPVPYTGLLTKAESVSGGPVYLASVSIVDSTYATSANITSNFENKFLANAIYYLENEYGIKSNYSPFSISVVPQPLNPPVATASVARLDLNGGSISVTAGVAAASLAINVGYTVGFDATNSLYLYDYNVEDSGNTGNVDVYPLYGSFVVRLAGTYSLKIRKLHVDGKIYEETISITVIN
jgi:hypothetical protein